MKYCPHCGDLTLRLIETIEQGDEYKDVMTCDKCEKIVNVFRSVQTPAHKDIHFLAELSASERREYLARFKRDGSDMGQS